ncbi:phosphodiesterase [Sulfurifustis variabilis]|uniref:Phosphodiesterase n=1 Tax=Sulfurifustis variabilis TaxID=1675686 RepID=A0A1B4VDB0_9GAMM|nr:alkaline phosphatase family protein [Sulfurifustis variabilis]BAU47637.1 phosphodiesterase [Sulfurifustis variabilis]
MPLPDYRGGSLVNLMSALLRALGAEPPTAYPPVALLGPDLDRRTVVLLVVDGMGDEFLLRTHAPALAGRRRGRLTSVFPSTTATAITTFLTGEAPQQHGLTGWHTYLKELGSIVTVLPFVARHGGESLSRAGIQAGPLLGHTPVFDRLRARSVVVAPERIIHSDFNVAHSGRAELRGFATLAQLFGTVAAVARSATERTYVYAYWSELDHLAHEQGIGSRAVRAHLAELDGAFGRFLAHLRGTDTTVIVTADHGFIDVPPEHNIELDAHPGLAETLVLPLCGERRAPYCYVHPQRRDDFERYVRERLGHACELHESSALIDEGWFGLGPPHPRLHERVGHYTLVMKENWTLKDWLPGERRFVQAGVHGGLTADEMYVPLIVAAAEEA